MDGFVKQSTAHTFQMGPFIDDADGKTAEAALTIAAASVLISKDGAALAAKNDATALTGTGDSHGYYDCVLNATDTGTVGTLKVEAQIAGALPVWHTFMVLPANVYDSLVGGTDALQVHANEITANLITAAAIATGAIDADALAADCITAAKVAADVTTEIQTGLATAVNLATVAGYIDTEVASILAAVDTEIGAIQTAIADVPTVAEFTARTLVAASYFDPATDPVTLAAGGADATAFTAALLNAIADAYLDRILSTGVDSGADNTTNRTVRQALRMLRNKRAVAAGVLTVRKEDDATADWTAAVATTAGNPVSSVDPT